MDEMQESIDGWGGQTDGWLEYFYGTTHMISDDRIAVKKRRRHMVKRLAPTCSFMYQRDCGTGRREGIMDEWRDVQVDECC